MSHYSESFEKSKLLYWKKIIMAAESSGLKRIEWMRKHGISDKSYYYWHRKLIRYGMLDGNNEGLEEFELPAEIASTIPTEVCGKNGQGLVEYLIPKGSQPDQSRYAPCIQISSRIMIQYGGANVYIEDDFNDQALFRVLGVIRDVK